MTISAPSQLSMFEDGLEERSERFLPTPRAQDSYERSNWKTVERANRGEAQLTLTRKIRYEAKYGSISSPLATPANLLATPGSVWAQKMTVISGQRLLVSCPVSGPVGCCLRTCLGTSIWVSTMCWLTWTTLTTPSGRLLFRLAPSVHRTVVTDSGCLDIEVDPDRADPSSNNSFWPTPRMEGFDASGHRGKADSLHKAIKLWPTPQASPNQNRDTKPKPSALNGEHGWSLAGASWTAPASSPHQLWPTATSRMWNGAGTQGREGGPNLQTAVLLPTPTVQDGKNTGGVSQQERHTKPLNAIVPGKLSAAWVTRLMGYPDGYLELES